MLLFLLIKSYVFQYLPSFCVGYCPYISAFYVLSYHGYRLTDIVTFVYFNIYAAPHLGERELCKCGVYRHDRS